MITKLKLRNFQGIEKLELILEQTNSIVGPTDAGKSSILRGLRWLCLNRPDGLAFLRDGKEFVGVKVEVEDHEITRKKGKSNEYNLEPVHQEKSGDRSDHERSTEESKEIHRPRDISSGLVRKGRFKAFGQEVPKPIQEILNVSQVNFQTQFENPFWIGLSAGQLSKELNGVVDLTLIDSVLGKVSSDLKKAKLTAEIGEEKLKEVSARKESLAWVVEADKELKSIEDSSTNLSKLRTEVESLEKMISEAISLRRKRLELKEKDEAISNLMGHTEVLNWEIGHYNVLSGLVDEITSTETKLKDVQTKRIKIEEELGRVKECPLCGSNL